MFPERRKWRGGLAAVVCGLLGAGRAARADVDLLLTPVPEPCAARAVRVDLLARSDNGGDQLVAAIDAALRWDAGVLRLEGVDTSVTYPYNWLYSGFRDDSALDGMNDTWEDGNAFYQAYAQLGNPARVTPEGLLVVRLRFEKVRVGVETRIELLANFGQYTRTVVYDGSVPGLEITGALEPVELVPGAGGDLNCDERVNALDINPFVIAMADPARYAQLYPDCDLMRGDLNCDTGVNALDIQPFVVLLTAGK